MKIDEIKFSVLMSVYYKENPKFFRQAVESIINQTVKPSEVVIVKDGPLTESLELECNKLLQEYSGYVRFIQLEKNVGLGIALQNGVLECRYDLIARMDTDDISKEDRFEKQLKVFTENPNITICGGFIEEFSDSLQHIEGVRRVPLDQISIYKFAKRRNPFNHMTVMFKREAVLAAGNYQPFLLLEDYYLWYRLIKKKCSMINVPDILVSVRADKRMFERRGGVSYFCREISLYKIFYDDKYISFIEFLFVLNLRFWGRICPGGVRRFLYKIFFR